MSTPAFESPLEWPRFCYSTGPSSKITENKVAVEASKMAATNALPMTSSVNRKRKANSNQQQQQNRSTASAKQRRIQDLPSSAAAVLPPPPKIPEFAFSDLMRKMASKYQGQDVDVIDKENSPVQSVDNPVSEATAVPSFRPPTAFSAAAAAAAAAASLGLPFPAALRGILPPAPAAAPKQPATTTAATPLHPFASSLLPFGLSPAVNPFALNALTLNAAAFKQPKNLGGNVESNPLDLSSSPSMTSEVVKSSDGGGLDLEEVDEVDVLSIDPSPCSPDPEESSLNSSVCMEDWTVDEVSDFIASIESCKEYSEVFREHCIDGSGLVVLSEAHMTGTLGMKLGPVFRLKAAISQQINSSNTAAFSHQPRTNSPSNSSLASSTN